MKLPAQRLLCAGMLAVALCTVCVVLSGVLLANAYEPTVAGANSSIASLSRFHQAVRAIHNWLSFVALLTSALTLFGMLWYAWWRQARGLWWSMLALCLFIYASQLSGAPLPLTQHDARTMLTESRIAGSMPILGPQLKAWLLHGDGITDGTVQRWYSLHRHVAGVGAVLLSAGIIVWLWRKRVPVGGYLGLLPLALGFVLSLWLGTPTGKAATAVDLRTGGVVSPMWYAIPLHASLKWMQALNASAGWVGAIAFPTALAALGFVLPFLGRSKFVPFLVRGAALAGALLVLVAFAQFGSQMQSPLGRSVRSSGERGDAERGLSLGKLDERLLRLGSQLFEEQGCRNCHSLGGRGALGPGPALDDIGSEQPSRAWFVKFLENPSSQGAALMPSYGHLSEGELTALAEFLRSQRSDVRNVEK